MALKPRTRLGPYEILGPLGAGGMGEVYRARDTRLDREVAVKVLPAELAADPDRLRRFEQEARAVGQLNHPNVLTIHDLGTHEGSPYLVTELMEGETLREALHAGPIPAAKGIDYALQISRGVAAAHEKGVIHRDLKPENIFVSRDGLIKILDFGLAKSLPPAIDTSLTEAPTRAEGTRPGVLLGTMSYMSPEQVRGLPAGPRSDLFAFGAIALEILTGRRAFSRDTPAETMAAILRDDPEDRAPLSSPETPPPLARLVRECLEKDPERRPSSAAQVTGRLEAIARERASGAGTSSGSRRWMGIVAASLLAAALILFGWLRRGPGPVASSPPKLTQVTIGEGIEDFPAFSPDSHRLAFAADSGSVRHIVIKDLASGKEEPLTQGKYDEIQPAWSRDGESILFVRAQKPASRLEPGDIFGEYLGGDVWVRDLRSGRESKLAENAFAPAPSPDGSRIAVDAAWLGPSRIWILDRLGRNPLQLTTDTSEAVVHLRPRWSPDGTRIVFQNQERTKLDIRLVEVSSKKMTWITDDFIPDLAPVWAPSGREIYYSSARGGGINLWRIAVSPDGAPRGRPEQITNGAGQDVNADISAEGRRLVFSILGQNADLWKLPVSPRTGLPTGAPQELIATSREESRGAWSPDGSRIAFNSDRDGNMNIWVSDLRDGTARQLTRGPGGDFQPGWSPDGKSLVFFSSRSGNPDLWSVEVDSGRLRPLTRDRSMEINPAVSPDGSRIVYQSDAGGRLEVWVMNADGTGPRVLTSTGVTGHFLRWSKDGAFVYFRCPAGATPGVMRVKIADGEPEPVPGVRGGSHISFSPDGTRIMDVLDHKTLWVSPLDGGSPEKVFEFEDPSARIDYPGWSPDGEWILFDRFLPKGGDIWTLEWPR